MAEDSKDDVLIEKTRLETRLLAQQLTPSYRRRESFKTLISASSLIIAFVTVIGGFLSVGNWFLEQKKTRQARDEERLDRALTMLADESPGKRLAGVISLRSFTSENNDTLNTQVLLALSGRLALEDSAAVRDAILFSIEDLDAKVVSAAVLNRGLQSLAETSRSLSEKGDVWSTRAESISDFERDPKVGASLRATAQSIVALLRKGSRTSDLSGVYLGASDLTALDLSGINFDDAVLADSNFKDASLVGDSFDGADLDNAKFIRADLRNTKFTLSEERGRFGQHRNYVESLLRRWRSEHPRIFILSWPDFSCSDLRNADFSGHPLFVILADDYRVPGPTLAEVSPQFNGANLEGADLRNIRFVQITAEGNHREAFPSRVGFGNDFGNGYVEMTFEIEPDSSTPDVTGFSRISEIQQQFAGTNWQQAKFPAAVRQWLDRNPPWKDQNTMKPCEPRAKW